MHSIAKISIDAMGGDAAPGCVVEGVAEVRRRMGDTARFLLHGDQAELAPLLEATPAAAEVCEIRHTATYVSMGDKPSDALRRSRGSSMWNAVAAVKDGEADVAVSAGNTGALMAISKVVLRMMRNVHRPAIAASWPTPDGHCVVLDVGANVDCAPRQLVEFAIMGEAFHRAVHGQARPAVGLLNVGTEELKGNEVVRAAAQLIKDAKLDLNYAGFVEGDDISLGRVDVVVTDGFTGNVALKTAEGTAKLVAGFLRDALKSDPMAMAGAMLGRGALKRLKDRMDPRSVNGGVFLGLNGAVVKSHGGTDGVGFATALRIAIEMARSDFRDEVGKNLQRLADQPDGAAPVAPAPQPAEAS